MDADDDIDEDLDSLSEDLDSMSVEEIERAIRRTRDDELRDSEADIELAEDYFRRRVDGRLMGAAIIGFALILAAPALAFAGILWALSTVAVPESVPGTVQVVAVPLPSVASGLFTSDDGTRHETVLDMPVSHSVAVGDSLRAYYTGHQKASETAPSLVSFWVLVGVGSIGAVAISILLWRARVRRRLG